jgi:hypothetical protein
MKDGLRDEEEADGGIEANDREPVRQKETKRVKSPGRVRIGNGRGKRERMRKANSRACQKKLN